MDDVLNMEGGTSLRASAPAFVPLNGAFGLAFKAGVCIIGRPQVQHEHSRCAWVEQPMRRTPIWARSSTRQVRSPSSDSNDESSSDSSQEGHGGSRERRHRREAKEEPRARGRAESGEAESGEAGAEGARSRSRERHRKSRRKSKKGKKSRERRSRSRERRKHRERHSRRRSSKSSRSGDGMAIEAEEEARRQPAPCLADGADLDDIERMFADQDGYSLFQDAPTVAYGLEPVERVALHYRNDPTMCGRSLQDVPPAQLDGLQPSLEIARTPGEDTDLVVFRSVVVDVSGTPDHVILHGDVLLPLRLVQERRSHLKKWDIVTGRMALNHGKLYAAQGHKWVVIHVLRVNCGFRRAFRERAQEEAEREMQSRGLALHAKPRAEVVNPVLQSLARGSSKTSTSEQEAGLIIIRTYDDGKSRFRGVVGLVDEDGEWAVVSSNVFLDFGHVRSRWESGSWRRCRRPRWCPTARVAATGGVYTSPRSTGAVSR